MTPEQLKSTYRRMIGQRGEIVMVRRYFGSGVNRPKFEANVRAVVSEYAAEELTGGIQQGDRRVILLNEDLAWQFSLPLKPSDKTVIGGTELAIMNPDNYTRRVSGVLIAYELQVRG